MSDDYELPEPERMSAEDQRFMLRELASKVDPEGMTWRAKRDWVYIDPDEYDRMLAVYPERDAARADAERLAGAWAELLAFYPEAASLDELTEYLHSGDAALAAHDALTGTEEQ